MKNKYILFFFLVGLLASACNNQLDISPREVIDAEEVFTSADNLEAALGGAYAEFAGVFGGVNTAFSGELFGGDFNLMSELLASDSNLIWGGSFSTYREVGNKAILVNNTLIRNNWLRAYLAINNLNTVLANLDVADSQEQADRIEGEALGLRAMLYFDLVRFWSRPWGTGTEASDLGVPLVLTAIVTTNDAEATADLGRSNVAAVYQQVVDDLERAETLLEPSGANGNFFSTYAASAVLSRVYLQQGNFELAAAKADRVIQSGVYSLVSEPLAAFNNPSNSSEDIFAIQQSTLRNAGANNSGLTTFYARLNGPGRGDMQVQEPHFLLFEAGDLRGGLQDDLPQTATIPDVREMYYIGVGGQNSGQIQCAKYGDPNLNIPTARLAEMYLTRAEANFEAGTSVGAAPVDDINVVRARAGLDPIGAVTQDEIREERQRELAFEGFRLHDFKRWQLQIDGLPFTDPALVLPIPERELEVYDIPQNEGY